MHMFLVAMALRFPRLGKFTGWNFEVGSFVDKLCRPRPGRFPSVRCLVSFAWSTGGIRAGVYVFPLFSEVEHALVGGRGR